MRFASLGSSRIKRRRWRRFLKLSLIVFALLAGGLSALEKRCQTLRVAAIETNSAIASLAADTVWGEIPREAESFWPFLWTSKRSYEAAIEKAHPVKAELRFKGWGRFKLELEPLRPLFKLYWEDEYWYVSSEGKMWLASVADNQYADLSEVLNKPPIVWDKGRTTPFDIVNAEGVVHRSSLPVSLIKQWYDNVDFLGWTEKVRKVQTGKREGMFVVQLVLKNGKDGSGAGVLFPDNPELWREAGLAVKTIYTDITKISPDIFIDTTYKGKIIVSNRVK